MLTLPGGGRGVPRRLPCGGTAYLLPRCRHIDWSRAEYRLFLEALRPGGVVLDIGANVGFHALFFGKQVAPDGKVYAFEPALQSFEALRQHVAMNGQTALVHPVHAAVGDRPGTLSFVADGVQGSNHVAPAGAPPAATVTVPCVTVDGFCEERGIHPTVMKIDTEGFELQVLRGARRTIRSAGAGLVLFIELHPTFWQRAGYDRAELQSELDSLGLAPHAVPPGVDIWSEDSGVAVEFRPR
jgi:FkbM family methyltransferase